MHPSDFSALYESSYPYIYQLVFSVEKSHQTAEDTVQEIYLAAWSRFRHDSHPNPLGWLIITARHKAYDMLRRQVREAKHFVPLDLSLDQNLMAAGLVCKDVSALCEDESLYERIRPLLREDEFDLVLAHYEQGVPVNELAESLRISPSACYMRLHRARRKLSALLPKNTDAADNTALNTANNAASNTAVLREV